MSLNNKVIWSEGMFLNPQHFQQQERYFERYIQASIAAVASYGWGLSEFEIDQQLLALGKISVVKAKGVFPDGTPFSIPDVDTAPAVFDVPENTLNKQVYLAIPLKRAGAVEVQPQESSRGLARYYPDEVSARNIASDAGDNQKVEVGKLRLRVMLEGDDVSGYACIGMVKITESRDDKNVLLDDQFYATTVDTQCVPKLHGFLSELSGLLHQRAEAIAGRLADARRGGTAEVSDYMMLQFLNRIEPLANHLHSLRGLHPVDLYRELIQMAGEIATFVSAQKRPDAFPAYLHDDLHATFSPVMASLRKSLSMVYEQTAVSMPLIEKSFGVRVSAINDRSLLSSASFVLAVRADLAEEVVRNRLPAQIKIGPVERIRELVNAAMPGITLKALPVAPRQIPFRSETVYFELEKQSAFWNELKKSGGFAMHVGGDFPGLEFEFWAIRQ